jgi:superfamily I DNA/RNA helicase
MMKNPTTQQLAAIKQRGNFVLTAIPGSGKTFVVGKRIHDLHSTEKLLPHQGIASLSFTNNASKEIEDTYFATSGKRIRGPDFVGTIDSFLNHFIVSPYGHLVMGDQYKTPTILTSNEFIYKVYPVMKKYAKTYAPLDVTYRLDGSTTHSLSGKEQLMKHMMYQSNLLSLGDISYYAMKILETTNLATCLINRFPYLMIDEAQDCSDVQMKIIDILANAGHKNIMLIGDPYQSIYVWRNANPELFIGKSNSWDSLSLDISQRSGDAICKLLNMFHQENDHIAPCDDVQDCQVIVISTENLEEVNSAVKYFSNKCNEMNIEITVESTGILCGSNNLVNRFSGIKENNMYSQWKTDHSSCYSLPIRAKSKLYKTDYLGAVHLLTSYFYYQLNDELPKTNEDLEGSGLLSIDKKVLIWHCIHSIPNFDMTLDAWISTANNVLANTSKLLGFELKYPLKKKQYRNGSEPTGDMTSWLVERSESTYLLSSEMNVETIHQAKGKSYNAVLVPFVSRSQKVNVNKLSTALSSKDLFRNDSCEDERCIYVAFSRPKRLLVISVPKDQDLNLFNEFTKMQSSELQTLLTSISND